MLSILSHSGRVLKLAGIRIPRRKGSVIARSSSIGILEDYWSTGITDDPSIDTPTPRSRRLFSGWRFGISVGALLATFVFLVNITVLIWILASYNSQNGLHTIYEGSCLRVKTSSRWLHLGINLLSTLLLGASNYCMQCLSSPTRKEVNAAHAENRSLEIGLLSLKNLGRISRRRVLLWGLIGLSSFPLHLLYVARSRFTFDSRILPAQLH